MKLFKRKLQKTKNANKYFYSISVLLNHEEMEKLSRNYVNEDNSLLTLRQLIQVMQSDEDSI